MKKRDCFLKRIAWFTTAIYTVLMLLANTAYADIAGGGVFLAGTVIICFAVPILVVTVLCFVITRIIRNKNNNKNDGL